MLLLNFCPTMIHHLVNCLGTLYWALCIKHISRSCLCSSRVNSTLAARLLFEVGLGGGGIVVVDGSIPLEGRAFSGPTLGVAAVYTVDNDDVEDRLSKLITPAPGIALSGVHDGIDVVEAYRRPPSGTAVGRHDNGVFPGKEVALSVLLLLLVMMILKYAFCYSGEVR